MTRGNKEREPKDKEVLCKLFVGNLKFSTTTDDLRDFYSKFGEIVDCIVMKDSTGKSRGFGFVTYKDPESVDEAQRNRPHMLGGRKAEPKRAIPRGEADKPEAQQNINKIFIGGLLEDVNEAQLEDYFSKYGTLVKVDVIRDSATGKKRGFAYLTFDDHDAVDKIVLEKFHTLGGKTSEVRKALSRDEMREMASKGPRRGKSDRDDNYRGSGGGRDFHQGGGGGGGSSHSGRNSNMMMPGGGGGMPGNFMGGPVGGGGGYDDFSNPGMGNPFDMLANMGMMGMMGNMMNQMGMAGQPGIGGGGGMNSLGLGGFGDMSNNNGNGFGNPMAMGGGGFPMGMGGMGDMMGAGNNFNTGFDSSNDMGRFGGGGSKQRGGRY